MLALKPDIRLTLGEDIMIQAIPELDHYYAFNVKNGDHFELNLTAHWVLDAIGQGVTLAELGPGLPSGLNLMPKSLERTYLRSSPLVSKTILSRRSRHEKG